MKVVVRKTKREIRIEDPTDPAGHLSECPMADDNPLGLRCMCLDAWPEWTT